MNARALALQVLLRCGPKHAFVQELLDEGFRSQALSAADRRLTTQLVYGVLRRRASLDALLRPFVHRPQDRVEPWLWETLRLGAFQLAFLSHIPPHAALFETVELASNGPRIKAKGFLNGVLRKLASLITAETSTTPAANALPWENGTYRRLAQPVLPDPATHPVEYLAAGFSWPRWLAKRWLALWGWDECVRLGFWFAGPTPLWLRVNPLRSARAELLVTLQQAGVKAEAGEHPQAIRLFDHANVRDLPGFAEGHFMVQDISAIAVASALNPQPRWRVLDLCAGPGGKTTHLAELMGNQGSIIACDIDERRLQPLRESCSRLGLTCIETIVLTGDEPPPGPFDAVLVDVPCSNTGVLGKRPEARWRLKPGDFRHLTGLQSRLLAQACERVRSGGVAVYSTCSIEPEENRGVVDGILTTHPGMMLESEGQHSPGRPADGGYWARLERRS
jgi:16S rRNA (cytosine967-C5)-methyltransferase